jgi:DNA invertase Pin-like site-specific DNA recombinase
MLRADLDAKQIRVVALDLSTSWMLAGPADDFTGRMFRALNSMMLDMLAAIARKHYEDRRRRQAQGVAKAKAEGKYRGRPEDTGRNAGIASMLRDGSSWTAIQDAFGWSRADGRQGRQASRAGIARRADELLDAAVYPASVAFRPRPAKK